MIKVYHCGNSLIEKFSLSKRRWNKTTHQASGLGLFFDFRNTDYLKVFGGYLYEITLKSDLKIKNWSITDFRNVCDKNDGDWNSFAMLGKEMSTLYDVIYIQELSGDIHQGIILSDSAVSEFKLLETVLNN